MLKKPSRNSDAVDVPADDPVGTLDRFTDGLQVAMVEGAAREFCSNLHYLEWWKREHPDEDAAMSRDIWEH